PIVIGIFEAHAIQNRISNSFFPRPLTHDLLANILQEIGVTVERIVVTKLEKTVVDDEEHGTFFARIHLALPSGEKVDVDARPSDAIAVAVRVECPIFAEEEVLNQSGAL
ncbi:MAG TPA: bifunctional nuclease family protein, partial [bacterium]|nr:bifunctional nuclease family protein [bacterium]